MVLLWQTGFFVLSCVFPSSLTCSSHIYLVSSPLRCQIVPSRMVIISVLLAILLSSLKYFLMLRFLSACALVFFTEWLSHCMFLYTGGGRVLHPTPESFTRLRLRESPDKATRSCNETHFISLITASQFQALTLYIMSLQQRYLQPRGQNTGDIIEATDVYKYILVHISTGHDHELS